MANKPNNPSLWSKAKSLAKQKFDVYPSAYANGWAAKWYKSKGGTWSKAGYGMEIMEDGGIPDNEGFRALPLRVQKQIVDNMAFGGYIPEMLFGGVKKRIQEAAPMLMQMAPMLMGAPPMPMMAKGGEPDGAMALGQIDAAIDKLQKLRQFIQPESDLEPWVSSKLTLMDHYTDAVADYMQYNPEAQEQPQGLMKNGGQKAYYDDGMDAWVYEDGTVGPNGPANMKNGGGIPQRYKNMGFTKVGVKKESTRPGKKWMVLAKKGSDYKVVHGGYDGMKDFSQHGSEKRKANFWNRMGGKDSSKAKDPFSPLYWHKRFGTWQTGGQPSVYKPLSDDELSALAHQFRGAGSGKSSYIRNFDNTVNELGYLTPREKAQLEKYMDSRSGLQSFWEGLPNLLGGSGAAGLPTKSRLKSADRANYFSGDDGYTRWVNYMQSQGYKKGGSTFSGNAFYQGGGFVEGQEIEVTPQQAEQLRAQGVQFEII